MSALNRLTSARVAVVAAAIVLAFVAVLAAPGKALAGPTYRFVGTAHVSSSAPKHYALGLDGLGCVSANDCVIVGPDLAKSFDGQHVVAIAGLNGPGTLTTDGVDPNDWHAASCAPDGACMMVSLDGFASGHGAFRSSATASWTRVAMPMPQPDNSADKWSAFYQNVSCASATFCLATANADTGQVWRWDGHAWHLAKLKVSVPHFGTVFFSGVSCAAARECVVVGHRSIRISGSPAYGEAPFRAVLDGNTWSVANLSVPTGTVDEQADTVSCWSVKHCRILGSTTQLDDVTAWEWSGNSFNATAGYADSKVPKLHSMSCTSATFCVAAGWDNPVNSVPSHSAHLDLLWNGIAWTSLAVHRTPLGGNGPAYTTTDGVVCSAAYACRLVGNDTNFTAYSTFLDSLQAS